MMTDYNAQLLKEARKYQQNGRFNSVYFENGMVKAISAMNGNLYEIKSYADLDGDLGVPVEQQEIPPTSPSKQKKQRNRDSDCQTPTYYQNFFSDDSCCED
jgi:hypothetical protein